MIQNDIQNTIIIKSTRECGFFSCLLGIIYNAYKYRINGIVPYIEWKNPKYMGNSNDNVFDYFFNQSEKPTHISKEIIEKGLREKDILEMAKCNNRTFREQMNHMFNTVCKLNIQTKIEIETFIKNEKINSKYGFHIRQTDRYKGGKGLVYAGPTVDTIINYAITNELDDIYLATDCKNTFSKLENKFKCVSYTTIRSSKNIGIHESNHIKEKNKQIAKEALIESYLLSECKALYRVTSNFTIFSLIVNPTLPFYDLSKIFKEDIIKHFNLKELYCEDFLSK